MTAPGADVHEARSLREIRDALDSTSLSPAAERAAEKAHADAELAELELIRTRYDNVTAYISDRSTGLITDAQSVAADADEIWEDVRNGRLSAKDARGQLRDLVAIHSGMRDALDALVEADGRAERLAVADPEDFQEERLRNYPSTRSALPTLAERIAKHITEASERKAARLRR